METPDADKPQSHFTSQSATAEDVLKAQTSGLVTLSDFRKRRAEAFELREKEAQDATRGVTPGSGYSTPHDGSSTPLPPKTKKKKAITRGKLSFGVDDEDDDVAVVGQPSKKPKITKTDSGMKSIGKRESDTHPKDATTLHKRLGPSQAIPGAPKILSKSAALKEAEMREQLRKEFLLMQEAVKNTEILIPFVFYDGSNIPGGICRVKKGDHIWLMLDRSRKVGAELGVGGSDKSRREWARVGVDDLMLVRGEIIVPHHYDFYYFLVNKSQGFSGPIFDYSDKPTAATPQVGTDPENVADHNPLSRPGQHKSNATDDSLLEGRDYDPASTKVVDRRWYEKNKHIFPASTWEDFDPTKDYTKCFRKDTQGNAFFFS